MSPPGNISQCPFSHSADGIKNFLSCIRSGVTKRFNRILAKSTKESIGPNDCIMLSQSDFSSKYTPSLDSEDSLNAYISYLESIFIRRFFSGETRTAYFDVFRSISKNGDIKELCTKMKTTSGLYIMDNNFSQLFNSSIDRSQKVYVLWKFLHGINTCIDVCSCVFQRNSSSLPGLSRGKKISVLYMEFSLLYRDMAKGPLSAICPIEKIEEKVDVQFGCPALYSGMSDVEMDGRKLSLFDEIVCEMFGIFIDLYEE